MQTYFPSSTHSSLRKAQLSHERAFTIIELLISIGIIGVISAIVLARYSAFDSTILLKGAAQELALNLREAQVKSVSAGRGTNGFDNSFGITFTEFEDGVTDGKTYTMYQFASSTPYPYYDIPESDPDLASNIGAVTIDRSMRISDICISRGSGNCIGSDVDRLDISFRRPEFKPFFYAYRKTNTPYTNADNISDARIYLSSPKNPLNVFVVMISSLGQISVCKQNTTTCK